MISPQSRRLVLFVVSMFVSACANLKLTAEQCREYCAKRGKDVASFHVGAAVPVIHSKPDVDCECADPSVPPH